ncbi:MAG: tripartite tricarboxylate transporter permease [Rhodobacteraceae bacterium]|nr:tripartite tricarboxylate transporter permease [Paracoccaceae bacterium]
MDAQYFEMLALGISNIFQWPAIGFLFLGIIIGLWAGVVPGIGGVTGLIILIPFTYGMDTTSAFALLLGMYAVVVSADTITSVMLGVPGSVASQATIIDGHAMARKGQAARALGAAFTCSAVGGVVGAILLALSIPLAKPLVLAFGMPEYFALATLGLIMVGSLSGSFLVKGIAVACLGLLVSMIGASSFNAVPRYWFEQPYLLQAPPLVSIVLGFFAIAEILDLSAKNRNISSVSAEEAGGRGIIDGIFDVARNWWLTLRSSAIGVYLGMLPGLGASITDWAAYGHAVSTEKNNENFGKGDVRGVIAPEAANNAQRGGGLIPTLAFGIPGDFAMAILLGALTIQGIRPGVDMLTGRLDLTFSMIGMLIIANIVAAVLLIMWSRQIARLSFVDGHIVAPVVLLFVLMGAWLGTSSMGDLLVMLVAGVFGYWFKVAGWPRPPLVIALVLGPIMENALLVSNRTYQGFGWMARPAVIVIMILIVLTLILAARRQWRMFKLNREMKMLQALRAAEGKADPEPATAAGGGGDLVGRSPLLSIPLCLLLAGIFLFGFVGVMGMRTVNSLFPQMIAVLGGAMVLVALLADSASLREELRRIGLRALLARTEAEATLLRAALLIGYVGLIVLGIYLFGQRVAIPIMLGLYMVLWGKFPWWSALLVGAGSWAIIELLYGWGLNIRFQRPQFSNFF